MKKIILIIVFLATALISLNAQSNAFYPVSVTNSNENLSGYQIEIWRHDGESKPIYGEYVVYYIYEWNKYDKIIRCEKMVYSNGNYWRYLDYEDYSETGNFGRIIDGAFSIFFGVGNGSLYLNEQYVGDAIDYSYQVNDPSSRNRWDFEIFPYGYGSDSEW